MIADHLLSSSGGDHYVGQIQSIDRRFYEMRLLLDGFREYEAHLWKHEGEGDAGETRSGSSIENVACTGEETPWNYGVEDVFDGGLTRSGNSSQVELLVDFINLGEMRNCFGNHSLAIGKIGGEYLVQLGVQLGCEALGSSWHAIRPEGAHTTPTPLRSTIFAARARRQDAWSESDGA